MKKKKLKHKKKEKIFYLRTMLKTYIAGVKGITEENEQLKQQIDKMKCCENCKHSYHDRYHTLQCRRNCLNFDKWEIAE